ncbi:uncharacterized protein LOC111685729 isoform X1 [Lucilia cuprina]|uniref:uncharacterized protein LOC111685729 isoform X1 n=1 Tax=Lucilia cuprina TaxID=7375 RepID=UPI001F061C19|nr:uncharacterized protein LOC111685729 isoform X1 [Lucilia cuprina]
MLAARCLRTAATRYTHPALCVWSSNVRTIPILEATTTTWYTRPLAVAYSKDSKPGVIFSFSFLTYRHFNTSSAFHIKESSNTSTSPLTETDLKSINSPTSPSSNATASEKSPSKSSSYSPVTKSSCASSDTMSKADNKTEKSSTASLGDTGVKLPSKDQVESFFFKSLVYLWDFAYYVFCLSHKLVEKYVFNNSTVQHYWNLLLKRMDDARKEIKSK